LNRRALALVVVLVAVPASVGVRYIVQSGGPMTRSAPDSVAATTAPERPSFPSYPYPTPRATDTMAATPPKRATAATVAPVPSAPPPPSPYARALHSALRIDAPAVDEAHISLHTLTAGTVLSATLVTQITSDLAGTVVAQLTRDAYDSRTGRILLIPRGTRLIGRYDNHLSAGQRRLLVIWSRLVFPDTRELSLPDLAAIDEHGSAGLTDAVDNHLPRVFGTAILLSGVGAAAQLSQPASGNALTAPAAGQVAAGALGQQMSTTALDVLHRGADIPPTITARAGLAFDLLLAHDLVLPASYADDRR
jgi:hypothetical protein